MAKEAQNNEINNAKNLYKIENDMNKNFKSIDVSEDNFIDTAEMQTYFLMEDLKDGTKDSKIKA